MPTIDCITVENDSCNAEIGFCTIISDSHTQNESSDYQPVLAQHRKLLYFGLKLRFFDIRFTNQLRRVGIFPNIPDLPYGGYDANARREGA